MYSKQELLDWLWEVGDGRDEPPSQRDLNSESDAPSAQTIRYRFESWTEALQRAGYNRDTIERRTPGEKYSDEELLDAIRALASELGRTPRLKEFQEAAPRRRQHLPTGSGHGTTRLWLLASMSRNPTRDRITTQTRNC